MDLQERLARLERAERRRRWLLAAAVAAAPLAWTLRPVVAGAAPEPDSVPALAVRNPAGTIVATVRATDEGSSLTLCDAAGKPRMLFAVGKSGPGVFLLDGNEGGVNKGVRVALSVNEKGPSLAIYNSTTRQPAAAVKLKADGTTGTFIATDGGENRFAFPKASAEGVEGEDKPKAKSGTTATPASGKKDGSN